MKINQYISTQHICSKESWSALCWLFLLQIFKKKLWGFGALSPTTMSRWQTVLAIHAAFLQMSYVVM